jgi:hypothetical protein
LRDDIIKNDHYKGMKEPGTLAYACNLSYSGGGGRRIMSGVKQTLCQKQNTKQKRWCHGSSMAQRAGGSGSIPSTAKQTNEKLKGSKEFSHFT